MKYIVLFVVALLAGCATTQEQVASGVRKYCGMFTAEERFMFRSGLGAMLDPGYEIRVTCPGDVRDTPLVCKDE